VLTRIEISGFKTFQELALDLMPFTVILGPNASGKSNLFDAIHLLSCLAEKNLREAFSELRGEVDEVFRMAAAGVRSRLMSMAVEVLLEPEVTDPWGASAELQGTRVRYELGLERRADERGHERLFVTHESARPIATKEDRWSREMLAASPEFRKRQLRYSRSHEPFLSTTTQAGVPAFEICDNGRTRRSRSAVAAEATVLSSITDIELPHLFALREEMRRWRMLQLDPLSLRRPCSFNAPDALKPDGSNLAKVLAGIKDSTASEQRASADMSEITADLSRLIPGVLGVDVVRDEARREYRVDLHFRESQPFSSRVVSDGTLRVLSLLTMLYDPRHRGLVCFEEPENGIHPARLRALVETLRERVVGQLAAEGDGAPLAQLVMNSHSPVVLAALAQNHANHEVVFADMVTATSGREGLSERRTRVRPVSWKDAGELPIHAPRDLVTSFEVDRFLSGHPASCA
jgi:predicted ATPase